MPTESIHARPAAPRTPVFGWLRPLLWAWLLLALPAAAQETAAGQPIPAFTSLGLEFEATAMALTEDGRYLVVAHEKDNRLTIWDVPADKKLKTIPCPSPRQIFCTAGKAYVANFGKGTVSVYSPDSDWDLENEALVGHPGVFYLSAPLGRHFDGKLLASCSQDGHHEVRLVDTLNDVNSNLVNMNEPATNEGVATPLVATVDAEGRRFTLRRLFSLSQASGRYDQLLARKLELYWSDRQEQAMVRQVEPGWWVGCPGWTVADFGRVFYGDPLSPVAPTPGKGALVIPDRRGIVAYVVNNSNVDIVRLDMALPVLASVEIRNPGPLTELQLSSRSRATPSIVQSPPEAVRHGDDAFLFVKRGPQILRAALKGALAKVEVRPRLPLPDLLELADLPPQLPEGEEAKFPLFAQTAKGQFAILRGPAAATVSADGLFSWTPEAKDVGVNSFLVQSLVDGHRDLHLCQFEVVSRELLQKGHGDLAALALLGQHSIDTDSPLDLAPLADGSGILLLNGERLRILDADGLKETGSFSLPAVYKRIFARQDYFVALGDQAVDLLDPHDGHLLEHWPLPGRKTQSLVLNPATPLCYVTVTSADPEDEDDEEESSDTCAVLCLDEKTGQARTMPGLCGQGLAIDPRGERLYVLWRPPPPDLPFRELALLGQNQARDPWINTLASYDLFGPIACHRQTNQELGKASHNQSLGTDGRQVYYTSGIHDKYQKNPGPREAAYVAAFAGNDLQRRECQLPLRSASGAICLNPRLELGAIATDSALVLFNSRTWIECSQLMKLPPNAIGAQFSNPLFTPDGLGIMFRSNSKNHKDFVFAARLRLDQAQVEQARRPATLPPPLLSAAERQALLASLAPPTKATIEALAKPKEASMTPEAVRETCQHAVVLLHDDRISGSGCFVSGDGYILATFAAVPRFGDLKVLFWGPDNNGFAKREAKARLVAADEKQGLVLMKIDPGPGQVEFLRFDSAVKENDSVLALGQLDQDSLSLDYGQVQGVVVQANGIRNELPFIQASRALNLKYTGAPALNARGNAIGLVASLRGKDNAAWIIPAARLLEFLKANSRGGTIEN